MGLISFRFYDYKKLEICADELGFLCGFYVFVVVIFFVINEIFERFHFSVSV